MTAALWGAIGLATLISVVAPTALRPLLVRTGSFDVPNHRSSHSRPTLRGGGIAPLVGLFAGGMAAAWLLPAGDAHAVATVVGAAVAVGLVGLIEDLRGLRVLVRAGLQFFVGGAAAALFVGASGAGWLWVPLGALFFASNVNFTNFMDGVNGISGLHGLVVGLVFAVLGQLDGLLWLTVSGLLIAGVFAAFLPWNLIPPGMFLGDVGSYLLGGAIAAAAIGAIASGVHPVAALSPLAIYWADTVNTLIRRAANGEPVFEAHRSHTYQRLATTRLGHVAVSLVVAALTASCAALGMIALNRPVIAAGPVITVSIVYLALPRFRGGESPPPESVYLAGVSLPVSAHKGDGWLPKHWVVLGATGFIGSSLVERLRDVSLDVVGVSAPRLELEPASSDGAEVAAFAETLADTEALAQQIAGADVVVNAAGLATPDASSTSALYGANSLLPAVVVVAATRAEVGRVIHLSSAAVQGDRPVLDESPEVQPFSPYSRSKALGERSALAAVASEPGRTDLVVVRATSVQGPGRGTTEVLRRVARSPLASVAAPGDHPTVVSSVDGLTRFVHELGCSGGELPAIALQPWEGFTTSKVLEVAGGRKPRVLPRRLCLTIVAVGRAASSVLPSLGGVVRRVELMWFGQGQVSTATRKCPAVDGSTLETVLHGDGKLS